MGHRLADQVAIITGASRGIGLAIAQAYAAEGATLCLIATDTARLQQVQDSLALPSDRIMTLGLNVTDRAACFDAVAQVERRFGRVDVLVNNAGVYRSKSFLDFSAQDFQDMLDVNLFGVLHFTQACLSKHAVVGLTRCVALEASPYAVTVNAICPGFIQTDMVEALKTQVAQTTGVSPEDMVKAALTRVPLGRVLEPSEIAGLAVYLGSRESSGMTGQSIHVDGGMVLS